jgi:hypothetical protein
MEAYIASITLEVNGEKLDDFTTFTEKERVFKKPVNLMNTTGTLKTKARHFFSIDYVVPANKTEYDFQSVEEGTVTIDYENGKRISFGQVNCLSIGEAKFDGDKEVTKQIEFVAGIRTEE